LGLGYGWGGISLKHFVGGNNALEGIGYFWNRVPELPVCMKFMDLFRGTWPEMVILVPEFNVGFYNTKYGGRIICGVDGVLGLDYKIQWCPINMSLTGNHH